MRKKLTLALALATTISGAQAFNFDDIRAHHCYNAAMATEALSGIAHALRVNAMDAKKKSKIEQAALFAMIANGLSIAAKLLGLYKVNGSSNIYAVKDIAEAFNAYRMYKNAKLLAERNKKLTLEQKNRLKQARAIMFSSLAVSRPLSININFQKAALLQARTFQGRGGFPIPLQNELIIFLFEMVFPVYEWWFNANNGIEEVLTKEEDD